jgi:uncharacterized protein (DUF1800 family)
VALETLQSPDELSAHLDLPNVRSIGLTALLSTGLAACGGGTETGTGDSIIPPQTLTPITPSNPNDPSPPATEIGFQFKAALNSAQAAAFLQQAQFSSTQDEIAEVRSGTYAAWLNKQYALPLGEKAWDWLDQRGYYNFDNSLGFFNNAYSVDFMLWRQLISAPDAMRKRVALALSEFFVVSVVSTNFTWQNFGYARWWDMLCERGFGNFRDLLEDVTLSPAMGNFLNTRGNKKENASGRVPDENYAREVMQLFTIGLYQLNPDGTVQTDASGKALDSYTQDDVTNLARVFTGYDFDRSDQVETLVTRSDGTTFNVKSRDYTGKRMAFIAADHSTLEAKFLGATVPAGTPGPEALKTALNTLFNHPNLAPFFAKQMIQRLVTSNPSPAYVARVASAFVNNGLGVRGDLKATWSAIFLDDEARNPLNASSLTHGKLREPMVRLVQWARTFGFKSASGSWKLNETSNTSTRLGQSPLRAPSVFNFFRPGFVPPNTSIATNKAVAPEFQIVNETTVAGYLNYMQSLIRNGVSVRNPSVPQTVNDSAFPLIADMQAAYTDELALVNDAAGLMDHVNTVLCAGRIGTTNIALMVTALNATAIAANSTAAQKLDRVAAAVYMAMVGTEYLVQK